MKLKAGIIGFLFFSLSSVISLALLELILSTRDPNLGLPKNGRVGGEHYTWGHKVRTNKIGFRERDFEVDKQDKFRVMVIGDSLTWGAGLAEEERYSNLLQKLLPERAGKEVEVLNFGVSGGPIQTYLKVAENYLRQIKTDLLIMGFCFNDLQPRSQDYSPEYEGFKQDFSTPLSAIRWYSDFAPSTAWYLENGLKAAGQKIGFFPSWWEALDRTYQPDSEEWKFFEQALRRIRQISSETESEAPIFLILNQSASNSVPTDYDNPLGLLSFMKRWYKSAEEAAKKAGFRTANVEKEYMEHFRESVPVINLVDGHPSAELNALYADKLSKLIAENQE